MGLWQSDMSTLRPDLVCCSPLPPEKSSSPPPSSNEAFSAPPMMTFLLPPQPVSVSPQRSIFSSDALGFPPYCSSSLHLEDLESFASEASPAVA